MFINKTYAQATVLHFNAETTSSNKQVIPTIQDINKIITSGKYAWAINHSGDIAFFDGNLWTNAGTTLVVVPVQSHSAHPSFGIEGAVGDGVGNELFKL